MANDPVAELPDWAQPEESFPYFAVAIFGAGLGWLAMNGLVLWAGGSQNIDPILSWTGLIGLTLLFGFLSGLAVFGVRRGMGRKEHFSAETTLHLLAGAAAGCIIIAIMVAALAVF